MHIHENSSRTVSTTLLSCQRQHLLNLLKLKYVCYNIAGDYFVRI